MNAPPREPKAHAPSQAPVSVDSQVQLLRSRVESELRKPAVLMVTSAQAGDGKSLTAGSLAASFAKSGHRAALVTETGSAASDPDSIASKRYALGHVANVTLPVESDDAISREGLAAFVKEMRADFDYTIVDAPAFVGSHSAMALTELVDGILLTVRVGRASSENDEMMVRMIDHVRSPVIGVVATDAAAIAEFERDQSRETAADGLRARPAERKPARVLVTTVLAAALFALLSSSSQAGEPSLLIPQVRDVPSQVVKVVQEVRDVVGTFSSAPLLVSLKD
jgi:Mrp family chromosome partitioning ATPase